MNEKEILDYLDQAASHAAMAYQKSGNLEHWGKLTAYTEAANHIMQTIAQRHAENEAALNRRPENPNTK